MTLETRRDSAPARKAQVRLLSRVLSYEDLLASDARTFVLGDTLALGRSEGGHGERAGELGLNDPWVSTRHARIERRAEHDVLVDLGSSNGLRVQGVTTREHTLEDGDLIEVGHTLLLYRVIDEKLAARLGERGDGAEFGPTRTLSPRMLALREDLLRIARSEEPVLALGETGSGKEVVAAFVHQASGRTSALRAVDCGAVPENLFESTFFGHRKGAFTGAAEARIGELALAHGGSLFLDEVGNLPVSCQAKLLRALETKRITPVGTSESQAVDVRFIAATNRDLFAGTEFRSDLLRRLAGYVAEVPALAARREDLGLLTAHFLREAGVQRASITPEAARLLFLDAFEGNLRQLRSTLRSAALLAGESAIDVEHLPKGLKGLGGGTLTPALSLGEREEMGESKVLAALRDADGNVVHAARSLGLHARQLYRLIARFGIDLAALRK